MQPRIADAAVVAATKQRAAHSNVDVIHGKLREGERVLIDAAAGGVGTLAVQLAKNAGAYLVATGSEENKPYVRELGADRLRPGRRH